ncbi:MAG: amidophosphoribosyltransferase [candidate division WS1 bacterium]|nr:amidophosphoribosyltransferase [candidate division WS1 bacterium]
MKLQQPRLQGQSTHVDCDGCHRGQCPLDWGDACGVFGIYAPGEEVSRITYFGLFALQHRGQESAGIAAWHPLEGMQLHKAAGLAFQVFSEQTLRNLIGDVALGHVRYAPSGTSVVANAEPTLGRGRFGPFAIGHNGNLLNAQALYEQLAAVGAQPDGNSDAGVMAALLSRSDADTLEDAIVQMMGQIEGAYSLVLLAPRRIIAVRDPYGVRPLCIGRLSENRWVVASETCALHTVGADFVREVEPGEMVTIDANGLTSRQVIEPTRKACCIFEFIYFARPDSHIYGRSVYMSRQRMGHLLAQQAPVDADLVIPVPESAIPHAMGYAQVAKIPYGEGFIKNRYIHRTFIAPDQRLRELGVKMKLSPLKEAVSGKRLVVVDDSIVRGTTTGPEIQLLRDAGAREIHLRINCPPIRYGCYYGVDTSARVDELIAARMSVEDIREHLGADSLEYLDMKNLITAVGLPKNNFCTACFDNHYPIPIPRELKAAKASEPAGEGRLYEQDVAKA